MTTWKVGKDEIHGYARKQFADVHRMISPSYPLPKMETRQIRKKECLEILNSDYSLIRYYKLPMCCCTSQY